MVSTDPSRKSVRTGDLVGRWQFYLDDASQTVTVDFRPDGRFRQQIVANQGGIRGCPGGSWRLEGSLLHLTGYVPAGGNSGERRTWWFIDTPSGFALFGGDGPDTKSFFPIRWQPKLTLARPWFYTLWFAAIGFLGGGWGMFSIGSRAFMPPPPPPGQGACGNAVLGGFMFTLFLTPLAAAVGSLAAALVGGIVDYVLCRGYRAMPRYHSDSQ
jgi:hypothetical protein